MRLIDKERPAPPAGETRSRPVLLDWRTRRARVGSGLIGLGLLCSLVAAKLEADRASFAATFAMWVASLGLALTGAAVGIRSPTHVRLPTFTRRRIGRGLLLVAIAGLALALRIPNLATIPPDVHGDEAAVGLDARAIIHGGWGDLFHLGWAGVPELSYAFAALVMRVFGDDLYGVRMTSVFLGTLSILLLYLVARRLFGVRTAMIAAFALAIAQWHIHFSRTGFHYMQAIPATLLVVLFMLRAFERKRELDFMLAGVSLGICAVVYYAGREIVPIIGGYLLYRVVRERTFLPDNALGIGCAVIGLWVFLAPVAVSFTHSQGALSGRAESVWLFAPDNLSHEKESYGTNSTLTIVRKQTVRTIEAVNRTGETSLQWGRIGRPLFDLWTAALIVPGVAYALSRIRSSRYLLLLLFLAIPMLACILAVDAPFSPHLIVALPALAVFAALVVDAGWRGAEAVAGRAGGVVFTLPVIALAALALHENYVEYFHQQVKARPAGFSTLLSRYVLSVNARDRVYLINDSGQGDQLAYDTVRFLVPHLDGADLYLDPQLPLRPPESGKGAAFIVAFSPNTTPILDDLARTYPGGRTGYHRDATGFYEFTTYEVGARELARRAAG